MVLTLVRHADVTAALADPAYRPPPAPSDGPIGTTGWLRASVARFSAGPDHRRRRDHALAELQRADPAALRAEARARTREMAGAPIPDVSRHVPVTVLGAALGVAHPGLVADIAAVAPGYRSPDEPPADDAVARLVTLVGPGDPEVIPARIGLLVQAYAATAGLIDNAVAADPAGAWSPEELLVEVLRYDPPVRSTWRISPAGELVELDLARANRDPAVWSDPDSFLPDRPPLPQLTFGGPPRVCPGRDHALAIAAGVLDGLRS